MVMESPSPQCVGREFVRQYYTLMNEAPGYLHRFYSADSSFVHSGLEPGSSDAEPVYGQKDIHKKIQELNFTDCHTKIRQVDSQATVGNGVVVQVTGELSNNAGPMRRFMQTFVLAHQTPKQYYVHNDIFRYQDEVFDDDASEDEVEQPASAEPVLTNGTSSDIAEQVEEIPEPTNHVPAAAATPDRVATPIEEYNGLQTSSSPQASADFTSTPTDPSADQPVEPPKNIAEQEKPEETSEQAPANAPSDNPPQSFSWAKIAGGGSAAVAVVPPMNASGNMNKQPVVPLSVITSQQKEEESMTPVPAPVQDTPQPASQPVNKANKPSADTPNSSRPARDYGGDRRTNERYPDNQQVFVGNLPQDVSEFQLKRFFNGYGKVVDMRINRGGGANSGKVPFGFVVFDSEDPVKELLKLKRVEMDGHRLNVEEKKARTDRAGSGSRVPRGNRQQQRAGSRPKDRENSGSRGDNRAPHMRKAGRP